MICARCDKPILPGQQSQTYSVDSASTASDTVTVHAELCALPIRQTSPEQPRSRRRRR